jgi:hypothetical protein
LSGCSHKLISRPSPGTKTQTREALEQVQSIDLKKVYQVRGIAHTATLESLVLL